MHEIEPHYNWQKYYLANEDHRSPFFGKEYSELYFTHDIYGYYIHPQWDYIGSETLFVKILYTDYELGCVVIELMGEWNDCLHNDVMHLKRNVIDRLLAQNITKYILIGENLLNFHGCLEDDYYAEWFDEIEEGWIAPILFRDHVKAEWEDFQLDGFFNYGGSLEVAEWRTYNPKAFCRLIDHRLTKRLSP